MTFVYKTNFNYYILQYGLKWQILKVRDHPKDRSKSIKPDVHCSTNKTINFIGCALLRHQQIKHSTSRIYLDLVSLHSRWLSDSCFGQSYIYDLISSATEHLGYSLLNSSCSYLGNIRKNPAIFTMEGP